MSSKIDSVRHWKGKSFRVLTATDYVMARLLDESGIPLLLVGDSLGMVALGYQDTTEVTMADMLHHLKAVVRAQPKAPVVVDLPYQSYENKSDALKNALLFMAAGADAVKLEGAPLEVVQTLITNQIPVMGHLGMLPQSVREIGGYKIHGKSESEKNRLLEEALALQNAGVFAIVLELVTPEVACEITKTISIPTIGIGSGKDCDGQVLVTHDLIGLYPWFKPKHVQPLAQVGETIREAVRRYLK